MSSLVRARTIARAAGTSSRTCRSISAGSPRNLGVWPTTKALLQSKSVRSTSASIGADDDCNVSPKSASWRVNRSDNDSFCLFLRMAAMLSRQSPRAARWLSASGRGAS